ncbi:MAG: EpsG family protein [Clostridia bacterium]|nr:EpsG family protein [Clostridia bacterium]
MSVYLINIALLILGYFFWVSATDSKRGKLYFCVQATIQWILISGLRGLSVGADTARYEYLFFDAQATTWKECFYEFADWFNGVNSVKDPGYTLFQKLFQVFSTDYQLFLVFIAIIFTVPMGVWIYRNSENPLLSFIIFSCLFYSFFAITGIRQTIVTGIMVFIGSELLKKKRYVLYYLLLLILIPIHKSVIALAIVPFIRTIKVTGLTVFVYTALIVFAYFFRTQLMSVLSGIVGYSEYDKFYEGAGASTFAILYYALTALGIVIFTLINKKGKDCVLSLNMVVVGAVLLPLTFINQSAMRAVQYFSVYLMLYVPSIINMFKGKERTFVNVVAVVLLVALLILNNPSYTFFWE